MNKINTIAKFNETANQWLLDLESSNDHDLFINPCEGCWSLSELYDHIIKVARSYQIPNFKQSTTTSAKRKKRKNMIGYAIFNLGVRKRNVTIQMQDFPEPLVKNFTPIKKNKEDLIKDFKLFIEEVNALKETLIKSSRKNKHHHPMFGNITAKNWFAVIEVHISHHDKQKRRIFNFLESK